MGVVCNGCVSGFLPKDEAFAVHYPGYPSSTSRAIETLGGNDGILKARSSVSNYLELHFRPEDPYSHPAFGELRHCKGLLLRLSRNKSADAQTVDSAKDFSESMQAEVTNLEHANEGKDSGKTPVVSETEPTAANEDKHARYDEPTVSSQLCADIVARVVNAYHFDGMVDYQHVLPVHAHAAKRKKRHLVQSQFDKDGFMDIDQDLMMLVPPLFSQKDIPENLVLRPLGSENSKLKQERAMQHHWEMDIGPCFALDFDIKDIPGPINCMEKISKYSTDWDWLSAITDLFNERPIWPRRSLHVRFLEKGLKVSNDQMKRLLLRSAYYFATGPFRGFWIRKGYDPRKDSESQIYQSIEFRVPKELRSFEIIGADGEGKQTWKDMCTFRVFPSKSFSSLQLYELDDEYIQQEIRKPTKQSSCNRWTGWFSRNRFRRLRLSVHIRFLSIHPSPEAKNLLKDVSKRLENCKKLGNLEGGLSDDEDLQPADGGW
ncbi:uncharacterized protein LOC116250801 isoform X2 [Nymphaea colorata]|uniref:uncharacterized protein LOC116250801 isoform X2 n=1 Tax=Nymphaea colorata TaxID=210225 RepID=UPI00129EEB47|nr:uncharacterized protein LOC116250801 isoform X2 [Nymphaea colorata]